MRKNLKHQLKTLLLPVMLIVAMAFTVTGCSKTDPADDGTKKSEIGEESVQTTDDKESPQAATPSDGDSADASEGSGEPGSSETSEASAESLESDANVLGEGETSFAFHVIDKEGNEISYEIHTDKETVGEALLENGLISGEDSEFGLYVKEVLGITADYDVDQTYWAFYINGEYAMTGVDKTSIKPGETYTFKVE